MAQVQRSAKHAGTHHDEAIAKRIDSTWLRLLRGRLTRATRRVPPGTAGGNKTTRRLRLYPLQSAALGGNGMQHRFGGRAIRQKVIGRSVPKIGWPFRVSKQFTGTSGLLALIHKPARQHGCRVFLDPLINESCNLLAKISRVAETRQLITLQRI